MHIKVSDILSAAVGANRSYDVTGEQPTLDDITLTGPINGQITVMKVGDGLATSGQATTSVELECHRCLRAFTWPIAVKLQASFKDRPAEDAWPIADDATIDISPLLRQEILLAIPIKQVCEADCPGLCEVCGLRREGDHQHPEDTRHHQPKIKKGP